MSAPIRVFAPRQPRDERNLETTNIQNITQAGNIPEDITNINKTNARFIFEQTSC